MSEDRDRLVRVLVDERHGPLVDERHPDRPDERYRAAAKPTRAGGGAHTERTEAA
ncbi:hypothetical protein ACH4T9_19885 [Micromonospora sp. NPDC020750]|uniref:hypothetical protein n=1 Tax=unclassified Micromonospora TaxID=2617518 RepID=UPI00379F787D